MKLVFSGQQVGKKKKKIGGEEEFHERQLDFLSAGIRGALTTLIRGESGVDSVDYSSPQMYWPSLPMEHLQ